MSNLDWNKIAVIEIVALLAIATLFILGCIVTGSVQFIVSWICSDYILGVVCGIAAMIYLTKCMKDD